MNNCKGFSLVEIMVAVGIFGVIAYNFTGATNMFRGLTSDTKNMLVIERTALSLFKGIQSNISNTQITYDPTDFYNMTSKAELLEKLPIAWNDKVITDAESCQSCLGRMGYVLVPHLEYRGLYKLTIRVVHKKLFDNFKDYTFLVNGN